MSEWGQGLTFMWAEVSSLTMHFLYSGLFSSLNNYRCFLRVLCPIRRPVTTLDWVLLKDKSLILVPGQGPEINSRACLRVLPRSRQLAHCLLISQRLSLTVRQVEAAVLSICLCGQQFKGTSLHFLGKEQSYSFTEGILFVCDNLTLP